ncbi:hypothetical protein LIER_31007 [Lithospermum erythrorhizon]|uniref:Integrase catalytic domain-containing protein n=1 Tax=Lithospermum erythrorhizon TaxID=34254 RepID=A0AAV3RRL0_LITER
MRDQPIKQVVSSPAQSGRLTMGELPNDGVEARKIKSQSYKFQMIRGELYKRSHLGPLLFCVAKRNIDQVLYEVHEGEVCGHHMGGQSLTLKITRAGYFWPTLMNDAAEYVKKCDSCQKMQAVPRQPVTKMTPVLCPVSFVMWGIDLVGKFLKPPVKYKDVIVAVDYFNKWVEALPMKNTRAKDVEEFIWKNIIIHFGIPKVIVSDSGPQFDAVIIRETCQRLGNEHRFAPVCYPQYNGQVEVMNRTIFLGIKKNLLESWKKWYEELDRILWSYQTTPSSATGEMPFNLVYDTKTVLPLEVCLPNIRQIGYEEDQNNTRLRELLDFGDEGRDIVIVKMQKYKQAMAKFYN